MRRPDLLPGVTDAECPPVAVIESRIAILRARRRAALHDGLQLLLLGVVDYLALHFPATRIPHLDRAHSMAVLGALHGIVIGYLWLSRVLPRWTARRIAATWSRGEQARFRLTPRRP